MEGAGPREGIVAGMSAAHLASDPVDPTGHFRGCPSREGHQQEAVGIRTVNDEVRNAMSQCIGFSGSSTGDHEERRPDGRALPYTVFNGAALLGIEFIEICRGCQHGWAGPQA